MGPRGTLQVGFGPASALFIQHLARAVVLPGGFDVAHILGLGMLLGAMRQRYLRDIQQGYVKV